MKKSVSKFVFIGIGVVLIALVGVGLYFSTRSSKTETFYESKGQTISIQRHSKANHSGYEAGDIIDGADGKEIVIGFGEDGRFVTLPVED